MHSNTGDSEQHQHKWIDLYIYWHFYAVEFCCVISVVFFLYRLNKIYVVEGKINLRFTPLHSPLYMFTAPVQCISLSRSGDGKWVRHSAADNTPPLPFSSPHYHFLLSLQVYNSVGVFMSGFCELSNMKGKLNSECVSDAKRKVFFFFFKASKSHEAVCLHVSILSSSWKWSCDIIVNGRKLEQEV